MSEKNIAIDEFSAELMDSLRRGYADDRVSPLEACPGYEKAIAYAFEELAADELQKVEDHLQSCRACMNLILDARAADVEARALAGRPARVLPALSDAISRSAKPSLIEKLAAAFRLPPMALKMVAAPLVLVCFVLISARLGVFDTVNFAFKKTKTAESPHTVTKKVSPAPVANEEPAGSSATDPQEEQSHVDSISTRKNWSTDPFEPIVSDKPRRVLKKESRPRTPLETLDPDQLKLVGIMLSDKGNTALLEDASGKGYVIKESTYIGTNAGKVIQILKDRVIVEEQIEDVHGNIIPHKIVMKLDKP
jgi:Tfp pilus assembly protein PilP